MKKKKRKSESELEKLQAVIKDLEELQQRLCYDATVILVIGRMKGLIMEVMKVLR
jgi:hypothetical protein